MNSTDVVALCALALSAIAIFISLAAIYYSRRQTIAAEASVPKPPPPIEWVIEYEGQGYRLRNIGTSPAANVQIEIPNAADAEPHITRSGSDVRRNESIGFALTTRWASGLRVSELAVTWDGQSDPVLVPLPSAPPEPSRYTAGRPS